VPLLALDLLAGIVPVRINARPPYMGRLKSTDNFMVFPFFRTARTGDWVMIGPHESGGGGRSLDLLSSS
jgi:hypothetical protein